MVRLPLTYLVSLGSRYLRLYAVWCCFFALCIVQNALGSQRFIPEVAIAPSLIYDTQCELASTYDGVSAMAVLDYDGASVLPGCNTRTKIKSDESFIKCLEFLAAENTALSTYRVTAPGETFIRYESANPAFTRVTPGGGVTPGTFAAPASDGLIPVVDRVPVYNLPSPQIPRPTAITLTPPPGTPIIGPRPVVGGTGNEVIFPMGY